MNTLRVKIALLMIVAIVSVVGLLTAVLFYLLGPPHRVHSLVPIAQQVETLVRVVEADTSRVPDSGPTVASRTTVMSGNAIALFGFASASSVGGSGAVNEISSSTRSIVR